MGEKKVLPYKECWLVSVEWMMKWEKSQFGGHHGNNISYR